MAEYCTVDNIQDILPKNILIGTNINTGAINVTTDRATYWIQQVASIIDGYLSPIYRIPLIKYKEPDFSQDPVTFVEIYPNPVPLINTRLAAANLYDHIMMAEQSPNISDWGKNQRALAFDDIAKIQNGIIQLKNQVLIGWRFVRAELLDHSRISAHSDTKTSDRQPGQ